MRSSALGKLEQLSSIETEDEITRLVLTQFCGLVCRAELTLIYVSLSLLNTSKARFSKPCMAGHLERGISRPPKPSF